MKTTKTLAKQAALIAVLALGSSAWLSAQQTTQGQSGQSGSGQQNRYGTNSQYNQGRTGQTAGGQNRQDNSGVTGTNSQYNQGRSGQAGSGLDAQQNRYGTNSQYNQGRAGQSGYGATGTNSQYHQGQSGQAGYGDNATNSQYNQGRSGQTASGLGQQESDDTSDTTSLQVTKINKGSSIIGATVKNQEGESLGKIRDLVIDFNSGKVAYIVLDSETGLFNAAKLHAVPLRAFQPDAEGTSLILKTDKTQLDSSEGFAKDNWPGTATATWGAEPSWNDTKGTSKSSETYDADRQHTNDLKNKTYKDTNKDNQDTTSEPKRSQPRP